MTRKIPQISLEDFETKAKKRIVMESLVKNVAEGVDLNLDEIDIAEIKNHDVLISIPKKEWKSGLEQAINFYVEKEEYEKCSKIKTLISKF